MSIAESDAIDPLCKLVSKDPYNFENQYFRLCVAVFRSSYFEDNTVYPEKRNSHACKMKEVSFRTKEALDAANGRSYRERMIFCNSRYVEPDNEPIFLYISRAYLSNQVFVYQHDLSDGKIYLENLSTDISIVDELNSFDFVEDWWELSSHQ